MFQKIHSRGLIVYGHDIFMAGLSFVVSIYLRLGAWALDDFSTDWLPAATVFVAICAVVFWASGLYRGVWRYASLSDLTAIVRAALIAILAFAFAMFILVRLEDMPRSLPIINWFVLMALLGGPRFFYRVIKDKRFDLGSGVESTSQIPVLLIGAGDGAALFIRALRETDHRGYRVVGIIAEHSRRIGREIHGIKVIGALDEVDSLVAGLKASGIKPQRMILTKDDFDGAIIRRLLEQADSLGMTLARLPKLTDFKAGIGDAVEIKPVAVEDLLGRPQTPLDRDSMRRLIAGRRILVTGAGGSIGSELVRQICALAPTDVALLDNSEYALYSIDLEISEDHPELNRRALIADVRDEQAIETIFAEFRPDLVFHAAALKHVPLVEQNIVAGVSTNVLGTVNVADACRRHGVTAMVMVSTDKAVNPTSVMGVGKRIAEIYCQALDLSAVDDAATRFVTVRFGNVLGSTGSVVPLFQRQLAAGGPLTVTDPEMTRYFMTIREAVELILQASALGRESNGETVPRGNICVLDMGDPVRILDLAEQMIKLAGLTPGKDINIEIVGLRPGEKLFEEVFHGAEPLVPTTCAGILLAAPRAADRSAVSEAVEQLAVACAEGDADGVVRVIRTLVPEFSGRQDAGPITASG